MTRLLAKRTIAREAFLQKVFRIVGAHADLTAQAAEESCAICAKDRTRIAGARVQD